MEMAITAKRLTRQLPGEVPVTLVSEVNVTVGRGEFVAITGPSGSGKSSLLYLLGLLDRASAGTLVLDGEDVSAMNEDALANLRLKKLGFVFQSHFLLPEFSALENVMLPMRRLGHLSEPEMHERAQKLLDDLGMEGQHHKLPKQLSGGQSQRVAIARALANDPMLILADEPTGNLDTASSVKVQTILKELAHRHHRAVVVVTHDMGFADEADRIVTIVDGKIQARDAVGERKA